MASTAGLKLAEMAPVNGAVMSLVQAAEQAEAELRARPPRQRTLICAVMRAPGIPGHDVLIRNVSERGMLIMGRGISPVAGERIHVTLPDGIEAEGQVRWARGDEFGIELTADLDLRRLGLTNQRRHSSDAGGVIHWLINERLRKPAPQRDTRLRPC